MSSSGPKSSFSSPSFFRFSFSAAFLALIALLALTGSASASIPDSGDVAVTATLAPSAVPIALHLPVPDLNRRQNSPATTAAPDAQNTETPTQTEGETSTRAYMTTNMPVPSIRSDNGLGADGALGIAGDDENAGGNGASTGNYSLSTGGIIGLSIGLVVVVLIVGLLWYLWFMAKKRQWSVRTSIRRLTGIRTRGSINPSAGGPSSRRRRGTVRLDGDPSSKETPITVPPKAKSSRSARPDDRSDLSSTFQTDIEKGPIPTVSNR